MAVRSPRTLKAATSLLERFAELDEQIAAIEAERRTALAEANAESDNLLAPLLPQREDLRAALAEWWQAAGHELTEGKRKSIALGGCEIGSRSGVATLGFSGDEKTTVTALAKLRWARELIRVNVSVDRAAVLKSIDGAHAKDLAALGFSKIDGTEAVFIKRVAQGGTIGAS